MGQSNYPTDLLSDLVDTAKEKMLQAEARLKELQREIEDQGTKISKLQREYRRMLGWSEIFDHCDLATRKMIALWLL